MQVTRGNYDGNLQVRSIHTIFYVKVGGMEGEKECQGESDRESVRDKTERERQEGGWEGEDGRRGGRE